MAFGSGMKTFGSGSRVTIKFSHDTNRPPVLRPDDIQNVLQLSPPVLMTNVHVAFWTDPRTLVIYYPVVTGDYKPAVTVDQLTIKFATPSGNKAIIMYQSNFEVSRAP